MGNMQETQDWNVPKLGFGMMRLPKRDDGQIDMEQVEKMVDLFLARGFRYVDTAYGYMNSQSEACVGRALTARHPRESFLLATKLPPWALEKPEDMQRVFDTQLERTGAGYFDFYLLHSLGQSRLEALDKLGAWDFLLEKQAQGLARHVGFSFHDTADVLDKILTEHPQMEFVQLQLNYMDWEDEKVQARLCYETARRHGKRVVIMEPVRGGMLANLGGQARALMEAAQPGWSCASWALRFAASLEGVVTVLSGMSTLAQMEENLDTMQSFVPLTRAEQETLRRVRETLRAIPTTPCTDCRYCTENCPQDIPIPGLIALDNERTMYGVANRGGYGMRTSGHGKASDCIACGRCESRCPQKIGIISLLRQIASAFE